MRAGLIVLGLGMLLLWLVGLNNNATSWLTWLDFAVGLASLGAAAAPGLPGRASTGLPDEGRMALLPLLLGVAILGLWIAGLILRATTWLTWWNFAFGIAYGILGSAIGATTERRRPGPRPV